VPPSTGVASGCMTSAPVLVDHMMGSGPATTVATRLNKSMKIRIQVGNFEAVCRMIEANVRIGVLVRELIELLVADGNTPFQLDRSCDDTPVVFLTGISVDQRRNR
jgi:hypothetical protein